MLAAFTPARSTAADELTSNAPSAPSVPRPASPFMATVPAPVVIVSALPALAALSTLASKLTSPAVAALPPFVVSTRVSDASSRSPEKPMSAPSLT